MAVFHFSVEIKPGINLNAVLAALKTLGFGFTLFNTSHGGYILEINVTTDQTMEEVLAQLTSALEGLGVIVQAVRWETTRPKTTVRLRRELVGCTPSLLPKLLAALKELEPALMCAVYFSRVHTFKDFIEKDGHVSMVELSGPEIILEVQSELSIDEIQLKLVPALGKLEIRAFTITELHRFAAPTLTPSSTPIKKPVSTSKTKSPRH